MNEMMRKITPLLSVCGLIIFALAFAAHNGQAQNQLTGVIDHFTDDDSFIIHGRKVRLWGIDAPEPYQNCLDAACGQRISLRQAVAPNSRKIDARRNQCRKVFGKGLSQSLINMEEAK